MFDGKTPTDAFTAANCVAITEGLNTLNIGVSIFDSELRLIVCNPAYIRLLDFPQELSRTGTPLAAYFRHNAARGEYGEGDVEALVEERLALARKFEAHSFQRSRPDGTVLEISGHPLPSGGFITIYTDITEVTKTREALEENEREMARQLQDIDLERAMVEQQAEKMVHMAEDLAVQNKEIEKSRQESEFQAKHDALTALPNRRFFSDHVEKSLSLAAATGGGKALLFIDLDNFKPVNDGLGHDQGDALLRTVATRLNSSVRDSDFVARLGGDEFAVLASMKPETGLDGIRHFAERIRDALRITVDEGDQSIAIAASIGIALFPGDADNREDLLQKADKAMYEAKTNGRDRIVFASELND